MSQQTRLAALTAISQDMENDVTRLNGQPLSGAIVGEIHGNLAAAISAIANIIREIDEEPRP